MLGLALPFVVEANVHRLRRACQSGVVQGQPVEALDGALVLARPKVAPAHTLLGVAVGLIQYTSGGATQTAAAKQRRFHRVKQVMGRLVRAAETASHGRDSTLPAPQSGAHN